MTQQATLSEPTLENPLAGKYLLFRLGAEEYGLEILKVREIIPMQALTTVPRTPPHVRGVLNLRGRVIPAIDLHLRFALEQPETTQPPVIVIVRVNDVEVGLIVDSVSEVLDVPGGDIEDTPSLGRQVDTSLILGLAKTSGRVTILLNVEKVLTAADVATAETIND
ncbi:MAG: chemotaxis protein CheW [Phycisphaerae bacterium]|nr:chemotaxis protein CheW [Phycisphaerae bacterium]